MNIFILDKDPQLAAQMLCDKHIVKMILETAQLLCGVFWVNLESNQSTIITIPYKKTHITHPCSLWVRESSENFNWLVKHGIALCQEYTYRYNKIHKSEQVIVWCQQNKNILKFNKIHLTDFAQAMPEQYKSLDAIHAYRTYYIKEKYRFAKWEKSRKSPSWFEKEISKVTLNKL